MSSIDSVKSLDVNVIKGLPEYETLSKIFSSEALELAFEELLSAGNQVFFDELLASGRISIVDLMQVIRFHPEVYGMFSQLKSALELLVDSRPKQKYKADHRDLMGEAKVYQSRKRTNFRKNKQLIDLFGTFQNVGDTLDLQRGMIRTIAFNYFVTAFQDLYFNRIAQFCNSIEEYSILVTPYFQTKKKKFEPVVTEGFRRLTTEFLSGIKPDMLASNLEEAEVAEVLTLAEVRTISCQAYSLGNLKIEIDAPQSNLEQLEAQEAEEENLFVNSMVIATLRLYLGEDYKVFRFNRGAEFLSVTCSDSLGELFLNKDIYEKLRSLLLSLIKANLESSPEDETIVFPDIFTLAEVKEIETQEKVDEVVDNEEKKTKNYSKLGRVGSSLLHRKLKRILGDPVRINGSHHVYESRIGKTVPVPLHAGHDIGTGLLSKILKQLDLTVEEVKNA